MFLVVVFRADVNALLQLYIVGVFVSFTTSQTGMVRHWTRNLRLERNRDVRRRMQRSRVINGLGAVMCAVVLLVVLITKFQAGARYAILAMAVLFALMLGIRKHYERVSQELAIDWESEKPLLPSHVHAIVCISKVHEPTMRALSYARASRPSMLEAVTVDVDPEETHALVEEWERRQIPVTLKVLASPYRSITRPILDYVRSIRTGNPRDLVTVYLPECPRPVVGTCPPQPQRATPQGAAAVDPRRDGRQRAVATRLLGRRGARLDRMPPIPGSVRGGGR